MGLCTTSNFSIFTFINASDLKFSTRSYSSCVYRRMRSNGKLCKIMTSHFRTIVALIMVSIVRRLLNGRIKFIVYHM